MQCIVHDIIQHANDKKTTIAMIPVASMLYIVYNDVIFMLHAKCYTIQITSFFRFRLKKKILDVL